jgi:glycosyltransferase involved in cell wall biosynthesis
MSRIALLLPDLAGGGAERVMLALSREFSARGHRVDLLLVKAEGHLLSLVPDNVRLFELGTTRSRSTKMGLGLSSTIRLAKWLRQEQPNALLSTITGANLVALFARRFGGSKTRVVIREAVSLSNVSSMPRLNAMKWLYPRADAIIAVGPKVKNDLIQILGIKRDLIHPIANPVDPEFLRDKALAQLAHPWIQQKSRPLIVSVGRLVPQKDHETLLRAFALLPISLGSRLIILGEGPERESLQALAIELGVSERVQLVGFDLNPWRWMAHADLYVICSRWEGHPNSLLEALALNLPVVATAYDDSIVDFLRKVGLDAARPGDVEMISRMMAQQLSSPVRVPLSDELSSIDLIATQYLNVLGCHPYPVQSSG